MKIQRIVVRFLLLFMLLLLGAVVKPLDTAYAATDTAVRVVSVEYYEEQIVVLNNGNSKIYIATEAEAAKNNWEAITPDAGLFTMIDISWVSPTVENILFIKGEENSTQSRIILDKKPLKLEITLNFSNIDSMNDNDTIASLVNIMTTAGTGSKPINFDDLEWKKGITGQWTSTRSLTVGLLEKYLVRGTYIFFRIRAVDDYVTVTNSGGAVINLNEERIQGTPGGIRRYEGQAINIGTDFPDGTEGRRFSNEVKVRVVKKAPAMVYGIDGSRFTADIKYGKEYRVTIGGVTSDWTKVTDRTVRTIELTKVINKPLIDGTTKDKAFPAMKIEVRDYSTTKASSSKITEISLDAQRTIDKAIVAGKAPLNAIADGDDNIYLYYNGNKNVVITIPKATPDLPYEYCVVKKGETLNMSKVVWSSITKGTEVKILATKAVEGGTLFVRQKEIKSKQATSTSAAVGFKLASTYVSQTINYPNIPEISDATFTFNKGYSGAITFTAKLNSPGKTPFETAIKSIKLGTKDIEFTTNTATAGGISTMTITLKAESLTTMANCTLKPITITFNNGTVNKTSIRLTIQNPVASGTLTITSAQGTNTGTTSFTVVTSKAAGNTWAYVITPAVISDVYTMDKIADVTTVTPIAFTTTTVDNITATASPAQYITVFELDASGYIIKYKSILVTSSMIK